MKIFLVCSKHFYHLLPPIQKELESQGHIVQLPNSYTEPFKEEELKKQSLEDHIRWKQDMLRKDEANILGNDAILCINYEKKGQPNYIGGATFLEIATAFRLKKMIYLLNPIPENIFKDELTGMNPVIIAGDVSKLI